MNSACRLSVGGHFGSSTGACKSSLALATRAAGVVEAKVSDLSRALPSPPPRPRSDGFLLLVDCFVSYGVQQRRATGRSQLDTSAPAFLLLPAQGSPRLVWSCRVSVVSLDYHQHHIITAVVHLCQPLTDRFFRTTPILTTRVSLRRNPSNIPARPV
jgi:hypothetical protein